MFSPHQLPRNRQTFFRSGRHKIYTSLITLPEGSGSVSIKLFGKLKFAAAQQQAGAYRKQTDPLPCRSPVLQSSLFSRRLDLKQTPEVSSMPGSLRVSASDGFRSRHKRMGSVTSARFSTHGFVHDHTGACCSRSCARSAEVNQSIHEYRGTLVEQECER
jgi:hypothetical protein